MNNLNNSYPAEEVENDYYTSSSIKDFIEVGFNINPLEILEDQVINVENKEVEIGSYNHNTNILEFKKVLNIVRKKDSIVYNTFIDDKIIETTKDHKFFVKFEKEPAYLIVEDIIECLKVSEGYLLSQNNEWVPIQKIEKTNRIEGIYDFEVEGNHNFFTEGFLSHNTMFGDPATTQGGNALKFGAHVRMKVSRSTTTDNSTWEGDTKTGNKTTVEIIKNKFGPPFRKASFNIIYGQGIDKISEIIDIAKDYEIINKRGDTIKKGEDKYTVEEFSTLLRDNPEFYDALREEIIAKYKAV